MYRLSRVAGSLRDVNQLGLSEKASFELIESEEVVFVELENKTWRRSPGAGTLPERVNRPANQGARAHLRALPVP